MSQKVTSLMNLTFSCIDEPDSNSHVCSLLKQFLLCTCVIEDCNFCAFVVPCKASLLFLMKFSVEELKRVKSPLVVLNCMT